MGQQNIVLNLFILMLVDGCVFSLIISQYYNSKEKLKI